MRIVVSFFSVVTLLLFGSIFIKLHIANHESPLPEAILVLGGGLEREKAAAQIAAAHPDFPVWVSSGYGLPKEVYAVFDAADVPRKQIHLDYSATDTVTNFTTLVDEFKQRDIRHLYVITSDFHTTRSRAIATLVLGHSGITFTMISIDTDRPPEAWLRVARDSGRSILWIFTGTTAEQIERPSKNSKRENL